MRLKKIKLAGFKSFVDPTSIPFPGDMTAIVGPNGCGKSNVIDAVRWVLGESSAKNLRGDAMTDVIFNGSSARKPVGQCSVELVFDNSSGRIAGEFANYIELSVKRLVTRDAQSLYFLNGTRCRRRDVTDLFLGTGLGPRSYAIIEQGMISRLIESKPQELRVFIEEAAGISKYKERRRETENRIRHTQDNLERLEDVRIELGQQLEKLQRQAAAARRYKALKAQERQTRNELAAIRYLAHANHMSRLHQQIDVQKTELEALVAQQRGDEAGIVRYREQQASLNQQLDDLQQTLFSLGNDITRLEQDTLYRQQRRAQIKTETQALSAQIEELDLERETLLIAREEAQAIVAEREPDYALLLEQVEQAQLARDDAEHAMSEFSAQSRVEEQRYHELKQEVQTCHSQIQATMSMQLRTQQRISELEEELRELAHDQIAQQKSSLVDELTLAEAEKEELEVHYEQYHQSVLELEQRLHNEVERKDEIQRTLNTERATHDALVALQLDAASVDEQVDCPALWQSFSPQTGWEAVFELVLSEQSMALVTEQDNSHSVAIAGRKIYQSSLMAVTPIPGTLAEKLDFSETKHFPHWFNCIYVVENEQALQQRKATLLDHESVISRDGKWCGKDWQLNGRADSEQGVLQRAAKIAGLAETIEQAEATLNSQIAVLEQAKQALSDAQHTKTTAAQGLQQSETRCQQLRSQISVLDLQLDQNAAREAKTTEELTRQQQLLVTEQAQLEERSIRLESLEETILQFEHTQQNVNQRSESLRRDVDEKRAALERLVNERHQLALQLQQARGQVNAQSEHISRIQSQYSQLTQRYELLQAELTELDAPVDDQQSRLQQMLGQREQLEQQRSELQKAVDEVSLLLQQAQQGQQGIAQQIQQRNAKIDSLRLEEEGYRVRADAEIEKLAEWGENLKPILESLPEDAEERRWQQELEKTSAAIARLGAVNLAAVEEYEVQAERKAHLDAQFNDLVEALETLQSAIRKIDKETRHRFSTTFEQVNTDLKELFPKVFGGGSAYLDLTDDDLLETGVTIMARPPGKKNSTIHLLSGGEKALTALSLVFAIFRLNPAPFCLLDEVDAPLDDANVGRFCNLVSEMSKSVQFIYITHNKIAMEMASHLTGVTMAEPGVSRMVAVDVEQAIQFAEA